MDLGHPAEIAEAVRATLDLFIHDHPDFEGIDVEIAEHAETDGTFGLIVDGRVFEVCIKAFDNG